MPAKTAYPTPSKKAGNARIEQLTITRFVAAMAIVIYHYGEGSFFLTNRFLAPLFGNAHLAVSYFFILSGFVMMIVHWDSNKLDKRQYYISRFARIYPIYLIGLLTLVGHRFFCGQHTDMTEFILGLLCLQSWIPAYPMTLNQPGWTLSVEVFFYIIAPFLFICYSKFPLKKIVIFIVAFWILNIVFVQFLIGHYYTGFPSKSHDMLFYFPLVHLNEFVVGNMVGLFYLRMRRPNINRLGAILMFLLVCTFYLLLVYPLNINYQDGFLAIVFAPFIYLLSINTGTLTKILSWKAFIFLGEISYSIYILHGPVHMWMEVLLKHLDVVFNLYLYLAVLVIICALTYVFVEIPVKNAIVQYGKNGFFKKV